VEEVLSMAVDNDHARSEHPRQGSTPASHVWTRQLNSQAIGTGEKEGKAFWPCNIVVLLTPKPGLRMKESDLVHVGI
jgi:hypothetical protein